MYPPRNGSWSAGWLSPAAEVARHISVYSPGRLTSQRYSHNAQEYGACGPTSAAYRHVLPPSTRTSTVATASSPAQAIPDIRFTPGCKADFGAGRIISLLTAIRVRRTLRSPSPSRRLIVYLLD